MAGGVAAATGGVPVAAGAAAAGGTPGLAGSGGTTVAEVGGVVLAIDDGRVAAGTAGADGCVVVLAAGAAAAGSGAAIFSGAGTSRAGRNASDSTPANATEDIHKDTRLNDLSTDAIDPMLTCWSITAKKLCVFPCCSIAEERGEIGIASYLPSMKVRLPLPQATIREE
jgi:hypothetical protein